jgi:predicted phosphodiesterase
MSRLALISDIHGNGIALDTVLATIARENVDDVICLGDLAAGGPQPREVISRLRRLDCQVVRGNADCWLHAGLPPGRTDETRRLDVVVAWARKRLAADDCEYLAALPATLRVSTGGLDLFCFHGSPRADTDSLLRTTPAAQVDQVVAEAPALPARPRPQKRALVPRRRQRRRHRRLPRLAAVGHLAERKGSGATCEFRSSRVLVAMARGVRGKPTPGPGPSAHSPRGSPRTRAGASAARPSGAAGGDRSDRWWRVGHDHRALRASRARTPRPARTRRPR